MKNKILNIALIGAALMATTSCSDFLETKSVSTADGEFVFSNMTTARAAMNGAYSEWHGAVSAHIFGDGLFYALDIAGSDIMRHPEKYANQLPRHQAENFYEGGAVAGTYNPVTYGKEAPNSPYAVLFSVVGKANAIASAIEGMDGMPSCSSRRRRQISRSSTARLSACAPRHTASSSNTTVTCHTSLSSASLPALSSAAIQSMTSSSRTCSASLL